MVTMERYAIPDAMRIRSTPELEEGRDLRDAQGTASYRCGCQQSASLHDQAFVQRITHQSGNVMNIQLLHELTTVRLNRLH